MQVMLSRTGRGWVVVNREGHPFIDTIAGRRKTAIGAYNSGVSDAAYKNDRRKFGVQVVRCTITTEPPATPATMEER